MEEKFKKTDLVFPELSYRIVGACMDGYNAVGGGKREAVYQRAVAIQLAKRNLPFQEQTSVPILCGEETVGSEILDFLVSGCVVLELKARSGFRRQDFGQVVRYLIATHL